MKAAGIESAGWEQIDHQQMHAGVEHFHRLRDELRQRVTLLLLPGETTSIIATTLWLDECRMAIALGQR